LPLATRSSPEQLGQILPRDGIFLLRGCTEDSELALYGDGRRARRRGIAARSEPAARTHDADERALNNRGRWTRHEVNGQTRQVQQLSFDDRPCCGSGVARQARESFPYLVKRRRWRHACARGKSMGVASGRATRWRWTEGLKPSKIRSRKFRSGRAKGRNA